MKYIHSFEFVASTVWPACPAIRRPFVGIDIGGRDGLFCYFKESAHRREPLDIHRTIEKLIPDQPVKRYLLVLGAIFFAGVAAGVAAPPLPVRTDLADAFHTLTREYLDLSGGNLFLVILMNNVLASLVLLLAGLLLGVVPVVSVGINGFVLGLFYRLTADAHGYGKAAMEVIPQGIFEIPALLVAASYGLWLGIAVLRRFRRKENAPIGGMLNHALERYFVVVFPLLVVAASVETSIILWVA